MRRILRMLTMLMCMIMCASAVNATNTVTVSNLSCNPGEETTLAVSLTNSDAITALQVNIPLSSDADLSVVEQTGTGLGRASAHTVSAGIRDNTLSIMVYSLSMDPIAAGMGLIATVKLVTTDTPFSLTVTPSVIATDSNGMVLTCSAQSFQLTNLVPMAAISAEKIDFGSVPMFSDYTKTITVRNNGTAPLVISGVKFSASTLQVLETFPVTIEAGSYKTLTIQYSPVKRGDVLETATIECNSSSTRTLMEITASPYAVNELKVGAVSGTSGEVVTIPLSLGIMDPVSGFTMEFTMPDALQYVDGSFAMASDRISDHSFVANYDDGKLRVNCYSLSDTPFEGTDGEIASFQVKLNGRYGATLVPDKVVLAAIVDDVITDVTSDVYGAYISIAAPVISVSGSTSLNRTPVTQTAVCTVPVYNYGSAPLVINRVIIDADAAYSESMKISQSLPVTIGTYQRADLTIECDGVYEGKIEGAIQIYCNDPDRELVNVEFEGERYAPNYLSGYAKPCLYTDGTAMLYLSMYNYDNISGVQFDVTYDSGHFTALDNVEFSARTDGFSVQRRDISTGVSRYFVYSLTDQEIASGNGEILRLPFGFDNNIPLGDYNFTISNMILSTTELTNKNSALTDQSFNLRVTNQAGVEECRVEDSGFEVRIMRNGIEILGVGAEDTVKVFTISGQQVYIQKGEGEINGLDSGIYMVVCKNKAIKILIP